MGDYDNGKIDPNEHKINEFLKNINSFPTLDDCIKKVGFSRHRTSSINGILKLEASLQVAKVMQKNNINTIDDFRKPEYPFDSAVIN